MRMAPKMIRPEDQQPTTQHAGLGGFNGVELAVFLLLATVVCALTFHFRAAHFLNTEPRTDQASAARLVQEVRSADHFLPVQRGTNFRTALEGDSASALYWIVKYFYSFPNLLFSFWFLLVEIAASFLVGYSYRALVGMSIGVSVLSVGMVGFWTYWLAVRGNIHSRKHMPMLCGAVGLVSGALSFYGHLYSPWGAHNFGVFALLVAGLVTTTFLRRLEEDPRSITTKGIATLLIVQAIAFYSHWTILFLLPPATVLAILLGRRPPLSQRLVMVAAYSGFVILSTLPVVVLMFSVRTATPAIVFAGFSNQPSAGIVSAALHRAATWILTSRLYFSIFGLISAMVGLGMLGFKRGIWFPLMIVVSHFVVWISMPGFSWNGSATETRTYNYLLVYLALGVTYAVCLPIETFTVSWGARKLVTAAIVVLACLHLGLQLHADQDIEGIGVRIPNFRDYLNGQGTLRPIIRDINRQLPRDSFLLTWDYSLQDVYYVLSDAQRAHILPAMQTMLLRQRERDLSDYLRRRAIDVDCGRIYVLSSSSIVPSSLNEATAAILGPDGLRCGTTLELNEIARDAAGPEIFVLYQVVARSDSALPN